MNLTEQGVAPATALSAELASSVTSTLYCGAMTPRVFDGVDSELASLLRECGVSDLGWRRKILVTGEDRLRWLNGMVSNTVQSLPEGQGNYSFLLSVQGRIQGDCYVYRRAEDVLLDTSADQLDVLMQHLDHFIIMDDVELKNVSQDWTGLGLAGPRAAATLETLGCAPVEAAGGNRVMSSVTLGEVPCVLVSAGSRYELWMAPKDVLAVWETLQAAGARPCGMEAMEALRVLEGTPLYGVDLNDRDLPQETGQTRALNFSKGCYLGQEIVERIRSRGKVNRSFRQFTLEGGTPAVLPVELQSNGQAVGRISSTVAAGKEVPHALGLGFVRVEVLERDQEITYEGGIARVFTAPPPRT